MKSIDFFTKNFDNIGTKYSNSSKRSLKGTTIASLCVLLSFSIFEEQEWVKQNGKLFDNDIQ